MCATLYARDCGGGHCLLVVLETVQAICCVLLCMLKVVEGWHYLLEVVEVSSRCGLSCPLTTCAIKSVCHQECLPSRMSAIKSVCHQECLPSRVSAIKVSAVKANAVKVGAVKLGSGSCYRGRCHRGGSKIWRQR
jgi:hypothetical protein